MYDVPALDCSDAAGLVSSMYSTPNASSALAIAILVLVSKNAFANCSPSAVPHNTEEERGEADQITGRGRRPSGRIGHTVGRLIE